MAAKEKRAPCSTFPTLPPFPLLLTTLAFGVNPMRGEWVRLVAEAASTNAFAVFHMTSGRLCREVSTERDLLHVGEIFYELPADNAGGFQYVHPVAATPRHIVDYDTWKGCLVLKEAGGALKIGVADDLWGLGKPVGVGGPWKETAVKAGVPSDAYLMNGFDRKALVL